MNRSLFPDSPPIRQSPTATLQPVSIGRSGDGASFMTTVKRTKNRLALLHVVLPSRRDWRILIRILHQGCTAISDLASSWCVHGLRLRDRNKQGEGRHTTLDPQSLLALTSDTEMLCEACAGNRLLRLPNDLFGLYTPTSHRTRLRFACQRPTSTSSRTLQARYSLRRHSHCGRLSLEEGTSSREEAVQTLHPRGE